MLYGVMQQSSFLAMQAAASPYWIATYGTSGDDAMFASNNLDVDANSNIYIGGQAINGTKLDLAVIKLAPTGDIIWQTFIGGATVDDYGRAIKVVGDYVYVAGATVNGTTGYVAALVAKLDLNGVIQWQKTITVTNINAYGYGVTADATGNVYLTYTAYTNGGDFVIAKLDSSGNVLWDESRGGTTTDLLYGIGIDSTGNVYGAGYSNSFSGQGTQAYLIKYNSSGVVQWQRSLGNVSPDEESFLSLKVTAAGDCYMAGFSHGRRILLAKYSGGGAIQWHRVISAPATAVQAMSLHLTDDALYIVGFEGTASGNYKACILKCDLNGIILWQRRLVSNGDDYGRGVAIAPNGDLYIAANTKGAGAGGMDILVARLPADGSKTGVYGAYTYEAADYTEAAGALPGASTSLTGYSINYPTVTSTLAQQAGVLTSTKIPIP